MLKALYLGVLFFVLVPGVVVSLPSAGDSLQMKAAVHAAVFVLVWCLTHKMVERHFG